jgi:hypothetical protein
VFKDSRNDCLGVHVEVKREVEAGVVFVVPDFEAIDDFAVCLVSKEAYNCELNEHYWRGNLTVFAFKFLLSLFQGILCIRTGSKASMLEDLLSEHIANDGVNECASLLVGCE